MRRFGAWLTVNALYVLWAVSLTNVVFAGWALASTVVGHFVPIDRSYGTFLDEDGAIELAQLAWIAVATALASAAAWSIVVVRLRRDRRLPGVRLVAALAVPVAVACVLLFALAPGWTSQIAILFIPCDAAAYAFVVAANATGARALRPVRIATVVAACSLAILALGASYDALSTDAPARARDRDKISSIRYAGSHYARSPNSPWTAKPPETTAAEMTPLHLRYRQLDANRYRICTTFETAVSTDPRFPHGAGPACYTMSFDDHY